MSKITQMPDQLTTNADYKNLVDLLAVLGEATDQLDDLQARLNQDSRELIDEHRADFVKLQTTIADAEQSIETLCRNHPEWFAKKQTLTTPYGQCAFRNSSSLTIPSEDATMALIRQTGRAGDFIRTTEELDKEALEKLSDAELAALGILRTKEKKFSAKPGKLEIGKAVAEAAKEVAA